MSDTRISWSNDSLSMNYKKCIQRKLEIDTVLHGIFCCVFQCEISHINRSYAWQIRDNTTFSRQFCDIIQTIQ